MVPADLTRREALRLSSLAVVGLAGCVATGSDESPTPTDNDETGGTPTPTEPDRIVSEWARNDVPPYPVHPPKGVENAENWNPTYLGEQMPTEPSLAFESRPVGHVTDSALGEFGGIWSYAAERIPDEATLERVLDLNAAGSELRTWVKGVDFTESLLVLVGDCCGSSSVSHQWGRVEETADGVHLHGYLTQPWDRLLDMSRRYSLVKIDRPASDVDTARVSLTVREATRLHFDTSDEAVTFVPSVFANDRSEPADVQLRITTDTGETRVHDTFTVDPETEWKGIGLIGTADTTFTVAVTIDDLGINVTNTYRAASQALGIRLHEDGEVSVGPSDEI